MSVCESRFTISAWWLVKERKWLTAVGREDCDKCLPAACGKNNREALCGKGGRA